MTTRTLSFQYGTLLLGAGQADANYTLTSVYTFTNAYPRAQLTFEVVISAATPAAFLVSEAALLDAYRKPDQKLTVQLTATDRHTFDPAPTVNTGLNPRATCDIVRGAPRSDRSARYRCEVVVGLPADLAGRAGRRSSTVEVTEAPSGRRTLEITGVYTALANNAARAQFAASIDAYALAVITALTGTFERVQTPQAASDDQDKLLRFRRIYREILRNQSAAGLDLAAVVDPSLIVRRSLVQTDSPRFTNISATPPVTLQVDYAADVRFAETTDLRDLWESTLRAFVLSEVEESTGTAVLAVTSEDWGLDLPDNRIEVTMQLLGDGGANFWQLRKDWQESRNSGVILRPVWDGDPFARDKYQGPASHTVSITYTTVGPSLSGTQGPGGMPRVSHPEADIIDGFEFVRTARRTRERSIGIAGEEVPIYIATTQYFYTRANTSEAGTGTGTTRERGSSL